MSICHTVFWGEPTKKAERLSGDRLRERFIENSDCFVYVRDTANENGAAQTELVRIEFHGKLAETPNMKNRRLQIPARKTKDGRHVAAMNIIRPDYQEMLKAMDAAWLNATRDIAVAPFGSRFVHMLMIAGKRDHAFDLIGAAESMQDWLEPRFKTEKGKRIDRGWGIGLLENDRQVSPELLHSWQTGMEHRHTVVILRPWEAVREEKINFVAKSLI